MVVPLAAVVFLALLWHLRRRDRLTAPRAAVALALCVYAAGVVANTVFPIFLDVPESEPSWKVYFGLVHGYDVSDALMNVLVFAPVGVIVPLLLARATWWRVLAVAAAFSLAIELTQFLTGNLLGGGHLTDVNDLFFNVVGAALGFGFLSLVSPVPGVPALLDRFRWN
ncbi:VanZ family protein [Lentzea sp. HUAS12]|uniref:VanZ family protein n=1 Tax=Lentzea sp. HUAS12 TaxID=2951806 RepID=UPI00209FC1EA|nr:VanZ family protein [Lentzea sp. HUAS12]USX52455.1 VanZ family protein [Lentzea sp. HUAS12]